MDEALGSVSANPDPNGSVRALIGSEREHDDGDDDKGYVPEDIEGYHRGGVTPIDSALLELVSGSLADKEGWTTVAGGAAKEDGQGRGTRGGVGGGRGGGGGVGDTLTGGKKRGLRIGGGGHGC